MKIQVSNKVNNCQLMKGVACNTWIGHSAHISILLFEVVLYQVGELQHYATGASSLFLISIFKNWKAHYQGQQALKSNLKDLFAIINCFQIDNFGGVGIFSVCIIGDFNY